MRFYLTLTDGVTRLVRYHAHLGCVREEYQFYMSRSLPRIQREFIASADIFHRIVTEDLKSLFIVKATVHSCNTQANVIMDPCILALLARLRIEETEVGNHKDGS